MRVACFTGLAATALCASALPAASIVYQSGSLDQRISESNLFVNGKHLAEDFTISSNVKLSRFVFNAFTSDKTASIQNVDLRIFTDEGNGPGQPLFSGLLAISSVTNVGEDISGFHLTDYAVDLPGWIMNAGKYFVSLNVRPDQSDLYWTLIGDPANPGNNWISPTGDIGTYVPHNPENLFRFEGARVAAPVLEPASWAMMLCGFGLVGATMRTARRRTAVAFL